MKKIGLRGLFLLFVMGSFLTSCGGDDDDTNPAPNDQKQKSQWTITCSDEVIGTGQRIVFTTNYETNNPNCLITWYDGNNRLNNTPRPKTDYTWTAGEIGTHTIKAVITDMNDIIEVTNNFEVIETDLGNVILGDKESKVLRTIISYKEKSGYIEYGTLVSTKK